MATYVLIHGAGDSAFYWHLVEPELRARGHETIAVDLPCEDDSAGFADYADAVVEAIGDRKNVILVAQSFGGFTAPLVCRRIPVDLMILVAAMVPEPGECADDWFTNTGYPGSRGDTEAEIFLNGVPEEIAREAMEHTRTQSETPGKEPFPLDAWPDVPTRFVVCLRDNMFPADWMREVVRSRLGIEPDEIDSGHCPALSRPRELAERLEAFRADALTPG